jgi:hypothetical protein
VFPRELAILTGACLLGTPRYTWSDDVSGKGDDEYMNARPVLLFVKMLTNYNAPGEYAANGRC